MPDALDLDRPLQQARDGLEHVRRETAIDPIGVFELRVEVEGERSLVGVHRVEIPDDRNILGDTFLQRDFETSPKRFIDYDSMSFMRVLHHGARRLQARHQSPVMPREARREIRAVL